MDATINHLPPEMVIHLFRNLNLSELIEKKLVCKLWNDLISTHLKITRLVIDLNQRKKDPWWLLSQQVDEYREVCHPNLFVSQHRNQILTNLKYLRIQLFDSWDDFNLNDLNGFVQLVQLEVRCKVSGELIKIDWSLPNLEVLNFQFHKTAGVGSLRISIDCKKLKSLFYYEDENDLIELKTPETITTLEGDFNGWKLAKFKNVEIYKCHTRSEIINGWSIPKLPKLKVLEMCEELEAFKNVLDWPDTVKRFLKQLLADLRKELRPDLRLFFAGIEISDDLFVDRLDMRTIQASQGFIEKTSNEHFYFGDYPEDGKPKLQNELAFVENADYNRLMSLVHEIPPDYFRRFWVEFEFDFPVH